MSDLTFRPCPACGGDGKIETMTLDRAAALMEMYARGEVHMTTPIAGEVARLLRDCHAQGAISEPKT